MIYDMFRTIWSVTLIKSTSQNQISKTISEKYQWQGEFYFFVYEK